jgi:hypothetical protein
MIAWILSNNLTQIAYLLGAAYVLNGLRKALMKPRLKIVSVSKTKQTTFVEVERQQLLPPWLTFKETWMKISYYEGCDFLRETDGVTLSSERFGPADLSKQLDQLLSIHAARETELQELLREEKARP